MTYGLAAAGSGSLYVPTETLSTHLSCAGFHVSGLLTFSWKRTFWVAPSGAEGVLIPGKRCARCGAVKPVINYLKLCVRQVLPASPGLTSDPDHRYGLFHDAPECATCVTPQPINLADILDEKGHLQVRVMLHDEDGRLYYFKDMDKDGNEVVLPIFYQEWRRKPANGHVAMTQPSRYRGA